MGPKVEKTYGEGPAARPRRIVFSDDQYPVWPLTPEQKPYAVIDGARMKQHVVDLAQIALRYRDAGHKWWGRLPGTTADGGHGLHDAGVREPRPQGRALPVRRCPSDWRPTRFRRQLQDRRRQDHRADDGVSGRRAPRRPGRKGSPPRRCGSASAPAPISSAATSRARPRHLQHVRAGRAQPFGQRSRRPLQRQHARRAAGRGRWSST